MALATHASRVPSTVGAIVMQCLEAGQRLITLSPGYYWGFLWSAMHAVGLGRVDDARAFVREAHAILPDLSFAQAQTCLGTMAPDVERRFLAALRAAGLE